MACNRPTPLILFFSLVIRIVMSPLPSVFFGYTLHSRYQDCCFVIEFGHSASMTRPKFAGCPDVFTYHTQDPDEAHVAEKGQGDCCYLTRSVFRGKCQRGRGFRTGAITSPSSWSALSILMPLDSLSFSIRGQLAPVSSSHPQHSLFAGLLSGLLLCAL
jgi:hypothetical protein